MYPYIVIVHTDRWLNDLSIILEKSNTLTIQSAAMNNASRDPIFSPVTHILI